MHRREVLQLLSSAALMPALGPLSAEQRFSIASTVHAKLGAGPLRVLNAQQNAAVTAVAEAIIPRTESPGATDARVNEFIDMLLADYYDDETKRRFLKGIDAMDAEAMALGRATFAESTPEVQQRLLTQWDNADSLPETATANFKRLKSLTIYGYFTSKIVMDEVTHPVIFHPAFEGCVPFTPGSVR